MNIKTTVKEQRKKVESEKEQEEREKEERECEARESYEKWFEKKVSIQVNLYFSCLSTEKRKRTRLQSFIYAL